MSIVINVLNQKLKIATNLRNYVSGTQKFIRFEFNLSDDWNGLTTFAQFSQNGQSYNVYLDDESSVHLPSEIEAGTCTLMLFGSNGEVRATTNYLTLTIDESILVSDAQSTDISTSLYEQLVTKVAKAEDKIRYLSETGDYAIITQADMIQDNETLSGYVKNRTHYSVYSFVSPIDERFVSVNSDGIGVFELGGDSFSIQSGKTYGLQVNGYKYVGSSFSTSTGKNAFGNPVTFGGEDNGQPFTVIGDYINGSSSSILIIPVSADTDLTGLKVTMGQVKETVHKLDKKYVPNVANPNALSINGQKYDGSVAVDMTDKINELIQSAVPTKTSELTNDSGYLTSVPVTSVNGKTGDVKIEIPTVPDTLPNPKKITFAGAVSGSYDGSEAVTITIPTVAGSDGSNGSGGVSPTVEVSKSGKVTTITITDVNGTKTATINDGADGSKGADGYTPVKGTDYWTDADKQEMIDAVLASLTDAEDVSF